MIKSIRSSSFRPPYSTNIFLNLYVRYAATKGVGLKGDIAIGVNPKRYKIYIPIVSLIDQYIDVGLLLSCNLSNLE